MFTTHSHHQRRIGRFFNNWMINGREMLLGSLSFSSILHMWPHRGTHWEKGFEISHNMYNFVLKVWNKYLIFIHDKFNYTILIVHAQLPISSKKIPWPNNTCAFCSFEHVTLTLLLSFLNMWINSVFCYIVRVLIQSYEIYKLKIKIGNNWYLEIIF